MTLVGWYVHHHGAGHLTRFLAVRPHLDQDVIAFSTLPAPAELPARTRWVQLPRDDDPIPRGDDRPLPPAEAHPTAGGVFHWAPLRHPGHASRFAEIASRVAEERFAAFVVDVSVEVAVLVRLLGVPVVVVGQPGERVDPPHRLAYDLASAIIAPWPAGAHPPAVDAVAAKSVAVGGISRFDSRARTADVRPGTVVVLGRIDGATPDAIGRAAAETPGTTWTSIGGIGSPWIADPWELLRQAEVIVSAAGQNSVADLAALDARAIVIPQDRPFDEQRATASRLDARGLAVVHDGWPAAARWPGLVAQARSLSPDWSGWQVVGAASRAAGVVAEVAAGER